MKNNLVDEAVNRIERRFNEMVDNLLRENEALQRQLFMDRINYGVSYMKTTKGDDGKLCLVRVDPAEIEKYPD